MSLKDRVVNLVLKGKDLLTPESQKSAKALSELEQQSRELRDEFIALKNAEKELNQAQRLAGYGADAKMALDKARSALAKNTQAYDEIKAATAAQTQALKTANTANKAAQSQHDKVTLKLKAQEQALTAVGIDTRELASEEKKLKGALSQVSAELAAVEQREKELKQAASLKAHLAASEKALVAAKAEVKQYAQAIDSSKNASREQRSELKLAEQSVRRLSSDYDKTQLKLAELNGVMAQADKAHGNLGQSQQKLSEKSQALNQDLNKLKTQQKQLSDTKQLQAQLEVTRERMLLTAASAERLQQEYKQTQTDINQSASAMKRSATEAARAEVAHLNLTQRLDKAQAALKRAGLETHDLSQAQAELTRRQDKNSQAIAANRSQLGKLERAMSQVGDKARAMGSNVAGLTRTVVALGATYLGIHELKNAFTGLLNTGGKFEDFRAQLSGAYGDVEKGEAAFEWIKVFARDTPNSMDVVLEAFLLLKNNGLDPMNGSLKQMIAANARYGKGQASLLPIIRQLTQAWAKAQLGAEDAKTSTDNGLPVFKLLSKAVGRSVAELRKMSENTQLGRVHLKALFEEMERSSLDTMNQRMKTWNTLVVKANDVWTQFKALIADSGVMDYFKAQLTSINVEMDAMAKDGRLQAIAKDWAVWIVDTAKSTKDFVLAIVNDFDSLAAGFMAIVGTVQLGINSFTFVLKGFAAAVTGFFAMVLETYEKVYNFLGWDDIAAKVGHAAGAIRAINTEFRKATQEDADDIASALDKILWGYNKTAKAAKDASKDQIKAANETQEALLKLDETIESLAEEDNGIDLLDEAFKTLGVQSAKILGNLAKDAAKAYEVIKAGNQPIAQQEKAFLAWAAAEVKAAEASGEVVSQLVVTEAASLGLTDQLAALTDKSDDFSVSLSGVNSNLSNLDQAIAKTEKEIDKLINVIAKSTGTDEEKADALDLLIEKEAQLEELTQDKIKQNELEVSSYHELINASNKLERELSLLEEKYVRGLVVSGDYVEEKEKLEAQIEAINAILPENTQLHKESAEAIEDEVAATKALSSEQEVMSEAVDNTTDSLRENTQERREGWDVMTSTAKEEISLYRRIESQLKNNNLSLYQLNMMTRELGEGFDYLDSDIFERLTSDINTATKAITGLHAEIDDTILDLQTELDELNGVAAADDVVELTQRRAEIEAQMDRARESNDRAGLERAQEALRLAEEIASVKARDRIASEAAQAAEDKAQSVSQGSVYTPSLSSTSSEITERAAVSVPVQSQSVLVLQVNNKNFETQVQQNVLSDLMFEIERQQALS